MTRIAAVIVGTGRWLQCLLRPARSVSELAIGVAMDLTRTRSELLTENAVLRQQVIVLRRSSGRPRLHRDDRLLLVRLARLAHRWREVLHLVRPETLLRWHRELFKIVWTRKSRPRGQPRRLAPEIVALIQVMARDNVLWVESYFNTARPHQGPLHKTPAPVTSRPLAENLRTIAALPILGGLHHDYQMAA